jgi:hypothetical protein
MYFLIFLLHFLAHYGYLQQRPVAKEGIYVNILSKMSIKIKFSLEKAMKPRGVVEVVLYSFFKLGTRWGGLSTPRPSRFVLRERDPLLIE